MRIKNVNLVYNVLNYSWNEKKVREINVMYAIDPADIRKKIKKGEISNYLELKKYLDDKFRYRFWSRAEYEIIVYDLCERSGGEKIDAYRQIKMNLDLIVDYVIKEMKIEFRRNYGRKNNK